MILGKGILQEKLRVFDDDEKYGRLRLIVRSLHTWYIKKLRVFRILFKRTTYPYPPGTPVQLCFVSNNIYPVKPSVPCRKLHSEPLHQDEFELRRIERVPLWSDINCRVRQRLLYAFRFDVWMPDGWYSCDVPSFSQRMPGRGAWNKRKIWE